MVLAETHKAAESVIQAFMGLNANIMVQEFIKEAGGDIRCLVVDGKVVAATKRQGAEGDSFQITSWWAGFTDSIDTRRTLNDDQSRENYGS